RRTSDLRTASCSGGGWGNLEHLTMSFLESLPNELLDQIIFFLTTPPPSIARIHRDPDLQIAKSHACDLKHLAGVSSHLRDLVRPRLFAHACFDLKDEPAFQSFLIASDLARYVTSVVVIAENVASDPEDQGWWRRLLGYLNPSRFTVVAPPNFIGNILNTRITDEHSWAFEIPLQILQLEREVAPSDVNETSDLEQCDSLLLARPWSSMTFNESSSMKAYHHYEYFLLRIPSVLGEWGSQLQPRKPPPVELLDMLRGLTSFSYTAVFPFYNHVKLVLDVLARMSNVKDFSIKLIPDEDNHVLEEEARGSLDLYDPWVEMMTSYTLVASDVGQIDSIQEIRCRDLAIMPRLGDTGVAILEELQRPNEFGYAGAERLARRHRWLGTMATSNVYTTEPAHPVLAFSQLQEPRTSNQQRAPSDPADSNWNLQDDWSTGIEDSKTKVFRYGTVTGFSRLRTRTNNNDEYIAQIPRFLLIKHLQRLAPSAEPSTFIIYPENFSALAPTSLLKALQSGHRGLSQPEAMKRLDSVQLFPIHHISTAIQAIGQISEQLHQMQDNQAATDPTTRRPPVMVIVVGLDTLAEGIIRASNPLKGTAVLASTLRTLTRLSRAYASFLSVLLVNTSGLGPAHFTEDNQSQQSRAAAEQSSMSRADGVHSIFQAPGSSLLTTMLMRTLDQGTDTHILLSDVKSAHVAEVIKDRAGPGLGRWGLWSFQK
ncbi:hypothetical protein N7468_004137, partial [Penicillium chermesinum]